MHPAAHPGLRPRPGDRDADPDRVLFGLGFADGTRNQNSFLRPASKRADRRRRRVPHCVLRHENATRVRIVVADSKIHILGAFSNIQVARDAVCALIMGAPPGKVYNNMKTVSARMGARS